MTDYSITRHAECTHVTLHRAAADSPYGLFCKPEFLGEEVARAEVTDNFRGVASPGGTLQAAAWNGYQLVWVWQPAFYSAICHVLVGPFPLAITSTAAGGRTPGEEMLLMMEALNAGGSDDHH